MIIKKIKEDIFVKFANSNALRNYHQTPMYAQYMENKGYRYEFIALVDEYNNIYAASLVLFKNMGKYHFYGYAPNGVFINYRDPKLLRLFSNELKKFYSKRNFIFLKINPEVVISQYSTYSNGYVYNSNSSVIKNLLDVGFKQISNKNDFNSILPCYNAMVNLKFFDFKDLNKSLKSKVNKASTTGLSFVEGNSGDLRIIYEFFKKMGNRTLEDYQMYYNVFGDDIDTFIIQINVEKCLMNARRLYNKELTNNNHLVSLLSTKNTQKNLMKKIESDKLLVTFKDDIIFLTNKLAYGVFANIGGAMVLRHDNKATIIMSGYDTDYKRFSVNHYMYYRLCTYYKGEIDFLDLNGISGNFNPNNYFYGLNKFKLSFNPLITEYVGEFDLVFKPTMYNFLNKKGIISEEFSKKKKNY